MMKKHEISCHDRDEMLRAAALMAEQGYSVKISERMMPFQAYGICIPAYKVIFWKKRKEGKRADQLSSLKRILEEKMSWRSDLRKTSVLSESSAR